MAKWRVGSHYGVHVYEGDRPVATFFQAEDAQAAVDAMNKPVYRDPPAGWVDFGTHANMSPVPPLEFSLDVDKAGMPTWERCVTHDICARCARYLRVTAERAPDPDPMSDQSPSRQHPDAPAMQEPQP